jgi:hypothetical protein
MLPDPSSWIRRVLLNSNPPIPSSLQKDENGNRDEGIDFDNYKFIGESSKPPVKQENNTNKAAKDSSAKKSGSSAFRFPVQRNYYTSFWSDYVVTQFDNSFLANNYQYFAGGGSPVYLNPGFNFLTKLGISDLFEDQRIVGGFRINPSLDNEFMLSWEQRKKQFDHQILVDRQTFARVPVLTDFVEMYSARSILTL